MNKECDQMSDDDELSFEKAIDELEMLVSKLETGDVSLDESIKLYERGAKLKAICEKHLKRAEAKITLIDQKINGEIDSKTTDFDAF